METLYYAQPYDISASGFFFKTYDEYLSKSKNHKNDYGQEVEEYELTMTDGENHTLFELLSISQATIENWFENFKDLSGNDLISAIYLADYINSPMEEILDRIDEVMLFEGNAVEYTENYITDCGLLDDMPENLRYYFNTEAFARDLLLGGDINEVEILGSTFVTAEV